MKVHSNFAGQTSKHRLLALSCATALASFAFIAKPALAEEATADSTANLDTRATTTANVETTADLVETKVVDATPATEATANTSEEAASVNTDAGTNLTTVTVSQEQTPDQPAVATNALEAQATNTESSASTGHYYSDDKGNWYYKDANGENLKGAQTIDGQNVYFENNGRQVKGDFAEDGYYYDGNSGQRVTNSYVRRGASLWFYVDAEGRKLFGEQTINNQDVYFDQNYGTQVKGNFASNGYYYDEDSGARVDFGKNQFVKVDNNWYYVDNQGKIVKGAQTIDGRELYFDQRTGRQIKGNTDPNSLYYSDLTGDLVKNQFYKLGDSWYYAGTDGKRLKGAQTVYGNQKVFFEYDGRQVKGEFASDGNYYDKDNGLLVDLPRNQFIYLNKRWYYINSEGKRLFGAQTIDGKSLFFHPYHGFQIKGDFAYYSEGSFGGDFYDGETGEKVTHKGFVKRNSGDWFYLDDNGNRLMGLQNIDGKLYYFIASGASKYIQYGKQVKGEIVDFVANSNIAPVYSMWNKFEITRRYYFDENTGEAVKNRYIYDRGAWYYFGEDGNAIRPESGEAVIDGQVVYLYESGKQAKGELIEVNGVPHYYDANTGARVSNAILTIKGKTYQFDADGNGKLVG
ncbi:hypothetical protein [Streptococcus sp. 449_SSPC]|uniref:hypothetical protein n=1 Tax=Streptococcus sp. 449_SSPC TaxID=1579339 RepID=UPI000660E8BA|nr:hypothetical protein [Streptococcus sp. 449_SSPC]